MARFDKAIATAQRLIKRNGQLVEWHIKGDPAPTDPDRPWLGNGGAPATAKHDVSVCFVPTESKEDLVAFRYLLNSDIQAGSTFGLMGAVPFTPTANNYVVRDGVTLNIRKLDTLSPNGQAVLHLVEFAA